MTPRTSSRSSFAVGTEIRLGDADDLALQLAVAQRVLEAVDAGAAYVDVSVPERAVVG